MKYWSSSSSRPWSRRPLQRRLAAANGPGRRALIEEVADLHVEVQIQKVTHRARAYRPDLTAQERAGVRIEKTRTPRLRHAEGRAQGEWMCWWGFASRGMRPGSRNAYGCRSPSGAVRLRP